MNTTELLPYNQKIFIITIGFILLLIVIELVRRRKILEQYSAIWLFISICAVCFIWIYPFVAWLTHIIGAGQTTSTILFGGFLALLLLKLQLSVKISEFSYQIKDMLQELTLLSDKINVLTEQVNRLQGNEESPQESNKPPTE